MHWLVIMRHHLKTKRNELRDLQSKKTQLYRNNIKHNIKTFTRSIRNILKDKFTTNSLEFSGHAVFVSVWRAKKLLSI